MEPEVPLLPYPELAQDLGSHQQRGAPASQNNWLHLCLLHEATLLNAVSSRGTTGTLDTSSLQVLQKV